MPKKTAAHKSNPVLEKIKSFVACLNSALDDNFVVAFQFISLDKVNGRNLDWHLYSIREKEYIEATNKFIEQSHGKVKRTVLNLEYEDGPYWVRDLGDSRVQEIPTDERAARQYISNLDYTYFTQELEFDINKPF